MSILSSRVVCISCFRHVLSLCAIWRPTTFIILRRYFYICAFVFLHISLFVFPLRVGQKWSFLACPSCLRHLVTDHSAPGFLQIAKKVKAKSSIESVYDEKHGFNVEKNSIPLLALQSMISIPKLWHNHFSGYYCREQLLRGLFDICRELHIWHFHSKLNLYSVTTFFHRPS